MKINEQNFPLIVKLLQNVTSSISIIDGLCKTQKSCRDCTMLDKDSQHPNEICIGNKLVSIRNQLATNPEYQEYLKQHNKPIKENHHENQLHQREST